MAPSHYSELSDDALIGLLFSEEDALPRLAALEILGRGAPMAERLLKILDQEELWAEDSGRAWAVVHATILLAASKLPRTIEALLRALGRADRYAVDSICDRAPELLALYGAGALPVLEAAAQDSGGSEFVRIWITQALGQIAREEPGVRDSVAKTLREMAQNPADDPDVRASAGYELLPYAGNSDRELLFGLSDPELLTPDLIERALVGGLPPPPSSGPDVLGFYDPSELLARRERGRLAEEGETASSDLDLDDLVEADPAMQILDDLDQGSELEPPPLRREGSPGRNEPCLCGSGKKYKKCCGR